MSLKSKKFLGLCSLAIAMMFIAPVKTWAQSYPFDIKKEIYHEEWIDLNRNGQMDPYENPELSISKRIDDLLSRMTMKEKTAQLATLYGYGAVLDDKQPTKAWLDTTWQYGIGNIDEQLNGGWGESDLRWPPSVHAKAINNIQRFFIEQTRLGIPVDFTTEGIRGLKAYKATSFPTEIAQASTWDTELINKIGHVEGQEARALGYTNVYAPEADVARDPRWGRIPSTYGESPYLVSQLIVAMTKGLQAEGVVSTLKHFAVYSVPKGGRDGGGRNRTDPNATPRDVFTIHLPPFKAAVEAGARGVMSSYNDYNGIPITGSYFFLTKLLRQRWGFNGYVVTDSNALGFIHSKHHVQPDFKGAIKQALLAGVNVRTNFTKPSVFLQPLREMVKNGKISMEVINQRVRDVLRTKFWLGLFDDPYVNASKSNSLVRTDHSLALSLKAAKEAMVLLKNKNDVLPLDKNEINSILVAGPNAVMEESLIGRYGATGMEVTSVLEGIKASVAPDTKVRYVKGVNVVGKDFPKSDIMPTPLTQKEKKGIQKAVAATKKSDVAIVVVGENNNIVGESRSRVSLQLPGHQLALVKAIQKTGTPTVVVLVNGRPLAINWIDAHVPAILEAWFAGENTGQAVAATLFGKYNPGGSLPVTFPKAVGQIPLNFPYLPGSQSYLRDDPEAPARVTGPLYPLGYGLSYTSFGYNNFRISPDSIYTGGKVTVNVDVTNTGERKGDEVVQLYINQETTPVVTPVRKLRGFKRITLKPGQTKTVTFTLTPDELEIFNKHMHWQVIPGHIKVMVGSSSVDIHEKGSFNIVGEEVNKMYTF